MLGLPTSTELNRRLPKNAIYTRFQMNNAAKEKIDKDISRIYIVNEVTASKLNLRESENVKSFFVMSVLLKQKDFDEKNIITLSKLIPQNLLMALEFEDKVKVTTYRSNKLLQTEWLSKENAVLEIKGFDLDSVWDNIILQIGDITVESGNTIDEQIHIDEKRNKIQKEINRLEKQARAEKQPKKKFELFTKVKELKKLLNS